jgi:transposase
MAKISNTPEMEVARALMAAEPGKAKFYCGLDVGSRSTSICVVDDSGKVVLQVVSASTPDQIGRHLRKNFKSHITRIAMESGGLANWLCTGLRKLGFPCVVLDSFQVHRVLAIKRNKTDSNDARGIAEVARGGLEYISQVHVKSAACFEIRALLTIRNQLVRQRVKNELIIRGICRAYGGLIDGRLRTADSFRAAAVDQMCAIIDRQGPDLRARLIPLLDLCANLHASVDRLDEEVATLAAAHPVCQRFMEIPGVGPIVAVSFFTCLEDPSRFRKSSDVAAYLGLTPRIFQSGETLVKGAISKMGNMLTRTHLVNAATVMLTSTKSFSALKDWGLRLAKRIGFNKAKIAVARKLATILFGIWRDGTHFQTKKADVAPHKELMRKVAARREAKAAIAGQPA